MQVQIARDDPNTEIFSWGCDNKGQLGLGDQVHGKGAKEGLGSASFNMPQPRFCMYGITIK